MNPSETHVDQRLVERLLAGDEAAFRTFFSTHYPRLFRFGLYRLHDEALAEDVVQSTLGKAIDKLETYRGEAALHAWLCTFCRHEIGAVLKRTQREPVDLIDARSWRTRRPQAQGNELVGAPEVCCFRVALAGRAPELLAV